MESTEHRRQVGQISQRLLANDELLAQAFIARTVQG